MKRAQIRGRKPIEFDLFLVAVERWEWSFGFGLGNPKLSSDSCSDSRHLEIYGITRCPARYDGIPAELFIMPDAHFDLATRQQWEPRAVGSIARRGGKLTGYLSIPTDALVPILIVLGAGRIRRVSAHGSAMNRGKSLLKSFHVSTETDANGYLEAEGA